MAAMQFAIGKLHCSPVRVNILQTYTDVQECVSLYGKVGLTPKFEAANLSLAETAVEAVVCA